MIKTLDFMDKIENSDENKYYEFQSYLKNYMNDNNCDNNNVNYNLYVK